MATYTVSSAAGLSAALRNASGGDEILLQSGDYGAFVFSGHKFDSYVTVRSADGNKGAVFDKIDIYDSTYLRVDNVHVSHPVNPGYNSAGEFVTIDNGSRNIEFVNSEVHGPVDGDYGGGRGIHTGQAQNVLIANNYVHDVKDGGVFLNTGGLKVIGNVFQDVRKDSMKFAGTDNVLVENNTGATRYHLAPGDHADFIQFQSSTTGAIIRGNVSLLEKGAAQGIFVDDGHYSNFLIEQNVIYTPWGNGIRLGTDSSISGDYVVRENTVLVPPNNSGNSAGIILLPGAVSTNNVIGDDSKGAGLKGTNLVIQYDDPNGPLYYNDVYQNAMHGLGIKIEDLRPVPGGPADVGSGMGAAERIGELLGESGDGSLPPIAEPSPEPEPEPSPEPEPQPAPEPEPEPNPEPQPGGDLSPTFREGPHEFDGRVSSAVVLPHDQVAQIAEGTVSIAFNADEVNGRQELFSKDAYGFGAGGHLSMYLDDAGIAVRLQSSTEDHWIRADNAVQAGTDHQLALTFGTEGMKLYVDGALVGSNSYTGGLEGNTEPFVIGANQWRSSSGTADDLRNPFDGTIAEVSLYREAVSQAEVAQLSQATSSGIDTSALTSAEAPPVGGDGDDNLSGGAGDELLYGRAGNDTLSGKGGDDQLLGNAGEDTLSGGDGADLLSGQLGADELSGGAADDLLLGGGSADRVDGAQGRDTLNGHSGADTLLGGDGADLVGGQGGRDALRGGAGSDTLVGMQGMDSLDGGEGDDLLVGGRADDVYTGGDGADVFVFGPNQGADTVTDFAVGDDRLSLAGASGPEALRIVDTESGALVTFESVPNTSVALTGVAASQLGDGDILRG